VGLVDRVSERHALMNLRTAMIRSVAGKRLMLTFDPGFGE